MKIGIIGHGFVGKATALFQTKENHVFIYDKNESLCEPLETTLECIKQCDIIFVCVPTPMKENGQVNLCIVDSVLESLGDHKGIILRSTVPPGTSFRHKVHFMPEFLTEQNCLDDFKACKCWVIGLDDDDEMFKKNMISLIKNAYKNNNIQSDSIEWLSTNEAEMLKYFRNVFLSTKIALCNELAEFCDKKHIDYESIRKIATLDGRIGSSHSFVPGSDGKKGFGGTCLPKDTAGLVYEMEQVHMESIVLKGVLERNLIDRPEQDWLLDKGRVIL